MSINYLFCKKVSRKVHIENPATGKTWCKLENSVGGSKLTEVSTHAPTGRPVCSMCAELSIKTPKQKEKPKYAWWNNKKKPDGFYASWEWAKLRLEVIKAYGAVCMCCGSTESIVVDHIKSRRLHPALELTFENMQVLCDMCNRGKSWDDETDFRPIKPAPELGEEEMAHMRSIQ